MFVVIHASISKRKETSFGVFRLFFFPLLQAASPIFAVKLVWRSKRSTKVGKGEKNVVKKKPKALPTKPKLTKKATTVGKPTQAPVKTKARLPPKKPKKPVKTEKPVLRMYMQL